ncbi:MAG: NAD(P)/FAD-dependent oxidoreductase [Desulfobacterota bacterium]|nr:NAD(P)/FAD-dependent oxidoreductase [Thermodesulfobacteriota bacterium]
MATTYDLVIVGAGPAGLMAAKVAGENGLRVALLERKENITAIQRSCATMFAIEDDYYFGERMYFNETTKRLVFPVTGFSLPYDGPYKNFYAWHLYTSDAQHIIRLGSYEANRERGASGRLSVTYSKHHLLERLLADARQAGVHVVTGANVVSFRRHGDRAYLTTAEGATYAGVFVIAADGINSRMMKLLGLNKDRSFYGTLTGVSYYMTGLDLPYPEAINYPMLFHKETQYPIMIWIEPSPFADEEFWVYVGGPSHPAISYKEELDRFISSSPFSAWFPRPVVKRMQAHVANIWSPAPVPFKDNVLIAGDAGWTVEAECTGSMMCGLKAAFAVAKALRDRKHDAEGVAEYIAWWHEHFPNAMDYTEFLQLLSSASVGEDRANYLYKLVTDILPCSLNPYNLIKSVNTSIMRNIGKIQQERPDILMALQKASMVPLKEQMRSFIVTGFPNT